MLFWNAFLECLSASGFLTFRSDNFHDCGHHAKDVRFGGRFLFRSGLKNKRGRFFRFQFANSDKGLPPNAQLLMLPQTPCLGGPSSVFRSFRRSKNAHPNYVLALIENRHTAESAKVQAVQRDFWLRVQFRRFSVIFSEKFLHLRNRKK
jgi:hypothetical protein